MKHNHVTEKSNRSIASGVTIGVITAVVFSILMAAVTALLIVNERISENIMYYFTFAILLLSAFAGGVTSVKLVSRKYALVSGITALTYTAILAGITILFFDGSFQNVWTGILAIALGYAGSCALCISAEGRRPKRKRFVR